MAAAYFASIARRNENCGGGETKAVKNRAEMANVTLPRRGAGGGSLTWAAAALAE